jgi:hypothetical protein
MQTEKLEFFRSIFGLIKNPSGNLKNVYKPCTVSVDLHSYMVEKFDLNQNDWDKIQYYLNDQKTTDCDFDAPIFNQYTWITYKCN